MTRKNRTQLILGLISLAVAAWLLLTQLKPEWTAWLHITFSWPVWIMLVGLLLLLLGVLSGKYEMAVPACIVAGIGGILYYQNISQDWDSWSYMWALIPGFGGVGNLLSALLAGNFRKEVRGGINTIFFSICLFIIFAAIFGGFEILAGSRLYILVGFLFLLGIWLIIRGILKK